MTVLAKSLVHSSTPISTLSSGHSPPEGVRAKNHGTPGPDTKHKEFLLLESSIILWILKRLRYALLWWVSHQSFSRMSFILIAFVLEGSPCLRYLLVASFPQPFPKASFPLVPHLHRLFQNSVFSFLLQLPIPELPFGFRKDLQGLELFSLRVPVSGELTHVLKKQLCLRDMGLSTYPDSTTLDTVLGCFSPYLQGHWGGLQASPVPRAWGHTSKCTGASSPFLRQYRQT